MAFGLFNTGSAVGAVIAPPLLAFVASTLGWRWAFYMTGAFGLVLAWFWFAFYRSPAAHPRITEEERRLIESAQAEHSAQQTDTGPPMRWLDFFRIREVQGMMLAKFLSDAAWFTLTTWMPKYLGDQHGLDIKKIGYFAWIPWVFAGLGSMTAGVASGWLQRSRSTNSSRKIILGITAMLLPTAMLIVSAPLAYVIVLFSVLYFAHQCFASVMQTLPADLFASRNVGSVAGLLGAAGSFGAMLLNLLVGWIVQHHGGYSLAFIIAGVLHPLAFGVILLMVRRVEPLQIDVTTRSRSSS
jgi:ACS family hexuronate transporter-like MFS transporter